MNSKEVLPTAAALRERHRAQFRYKGGAVCLACGTLQPCDVTLALSTPGAPREGET